MKINETFPSHQLEVGGYRMLRKDKNKFYYLLCEQEYPLQNIKCRGLFEMF